MAGVTVVSADELAVLDLFAGCSTESLVPLAAQLRPLTAAPGQVLMRRGERAVSFLAIRSGRVEVTHPGADGLPTVHEVSPGWLLVVLPHLQGWSTPGGEWDDPAERAQIAAILGRLHAATPPEALQRWDFAVPGRTRCWPH